MGHQVNFYLSDDDQIDLVKRFSQLENISWVSQPQKSSKIKLQSLSDYTNWKSGQHDPLLFFSQDRASLKSEYISTQGYYLIDVLTNPVIEFSRCIQREKEIQRGRLYYVSKFSNEDGQWRERPQEFLRLAKRLFSISKKFCVTSRDGIYIGPDALRLEAQGLKLSQN
jgi:hypothetical protein